MHRETWVASQQCWLSLRITNDTSKRVKKLSFTLWRTTTVYKMAAPSTPGGSRSFRSVKDVTNEHHEASSTKRCISETVLEAGQKSSKGLVTSKGWWMGVEPRAGGEATYSVPIPVSIFVRCVPPYCMLTRLISSSLMPSRSPEAGSLTFNILSTSPPTLVLL